LNISSRQMARCRRCVRTQRFRCRSWMRHCSISRRGRRTDRDRMERRRHR
jgi:hypothetical protein